MGDLPCSGIDARVDLNVLSPIWSTRTKTASRVRGLIESVLDFAKTRGARQGESPARWKRNLALALADRGRFRGHRPSARLLPGGLGTHSRDCGHLHRHQYAAGTGGNGGTSTPAFSLPGDDQPGGAGGAGHGGPGSSGLTEVGETSGADGDGGALGSYAVGAICSSGGTGSGAGGAGGEAIAGIANVDRSEFTGSIAARHPDCPKGGSRPGIVWVAQPRA